MSNVTSGSSGALAELSHWETLLSSVREARGTGANSSCQGSVESICLEEVRGGDFDFFKNYDFKTNVGWLEKFGKCRRV